MKVTFPHMGNMYIPLKTLFESLGVEVVVPPTITKNTLELGVKNSPEFACLPLKITIGNFIEAIELGADTIVMAGGIGPCRFGYYGHVQKEILKGLGHHFEMVILEPPKGNLRHLFTQLKSLFKKNFTPKRVSKALRFAWQKALLLDELDYITSKLRPLELNKGDIHRLYEKTVKVIENIQSEQELGQYRLRMHEIFDEIPTKTPRLIPRIGLVGEIYTVLEPFSNLFIEKQLGELGAQVSRSIYITDWIRENLFPAFLRSKEHGEMLKLAEPYVNSFVGGHGQETVAETVRFSQKGYDGVIQVLPFTCMPEIVAKSVLPRVSREHSISVMSVVLDEHSAETGLRTRLEAFIDMIKLKMEVEDPYEVLVGN